MQISRRTNENAAVTWSELDLSNAHAPPSQSFDHLPTAATEGRGDLPDSDVIYQHHGMSTGKQLHRIACPEHWPVVTSCWLPVMPRSRITMSGLVIIIGHEDRQTTVGAA